MKFLSLLLALLIMCPACAQELGVYNNKAHEYGNDVSQYIKSELFIIKQDKNSGTITQPYIKSRKGIIFKDTEIGYNTREFSYDHWNLVDRKENVSPPRLGEYFYVDAPTQTLKYNLPTGGTYSGSFEYLFIVYDGSEWGAAWVQKGSNQVRTAGFPNYVDMAKDSLLKTANNGTN